MNRKNIVSEKKEEEKINSELLSQQFDDKYDMKINNIIFNLLDQYDINMEAYTNIRFINKSKLGCDLYYFIKDNSSALYDNSDNEYDSSSESD